MEKENQQEKKEDLRLRLPEDPYKEVMQHIEWDKDIKKFGPDFAALCMMHHCVEIMGKKVFNNLVRGSIEYLLGQGDNFNNFNHYFEQYFHKAFRSTDVYSIVAYDEVNKEEHAADPDRFDESFREPREGARYKDTKNLIRINGNLDMIFYNLIRMSIMPQKIMKKVCCEAAHKEAMFWAPLV